MSLSTVALPALQLLGRHNDLKVEIDGQLLVNLPATGLERKNATSDGLSELVRDDGLWINRISSCVLHFHLTFDEGVSPGIGRPPHQCLRDELQNHKVLTLTISPKYWSVTLAQLTDHIASITGLGEVKRTASQHQRKWISLLGTASGPCIKSHPATGSPDGRASAGGSVYSNMLKQVAGTPAEVNEESRNDEREVYLQTRPYATPNAEGEPQP